MNVKTRKILYCNGSFHVNSDIDRLYTRRRKGGRDLNPLSANITKWSITLKQFVGKLPTNCLSVFHHFVGFAIKGLIELRMRTLQELFQLVDT